MHSGNLTPRRFLRSGALHSTPFFARSPNFKSKMAQNHDKTSFLEKFEKQNYTISLPKISKNSQMDFFSWSIEDPMIINNYGIPEPISNQIKYPDILLVPLVAYDKNLNRVGYGGGFYDRYIKKVKKVKKVITIGLAYSFQKVKKVPVNKYDIKLDYILTEKDH